MRNIVLVRSPEQLLKEGVVGYGWGAVNFSEIHSEKQLLESFAEKGINLGRQKNQVLRFYKLKAGDLVVVPTYRSIVIGQVTGRKSFGIGVKFGDNRVSVDFYKNKDGELLKIERTELGTDFASRLKIRMSVVYLNEFKDRIEQIVSKLELGEGFSFNSHIEELEKEQRLAFKKTLLQNLRKGYVNLKSGGIGLENLVKELLEIEGYTASIEAKNADSSIADIDVLATKSDYFVSNKLLIQVKHYDGNTGSLGIRQLEAIDMSKHEIDANETITRVLITTAEVSDELICRAEDSNIRIMDGHAFVDWLFDNLKDLSRHTLNQLGISDVPLILI